MGDFFKPDGPVARLMTLLANLICLNVLWLLCCIPIVTAGAATTAMYHMIFQYLTERDDAVIKPFFRSFRENFRSATLAWLPHCLIGAVIILEGLYINQVPALGVLIFYVIQVVLFFGVSSYLYPLLARFDTPLKGTVFNSFLLALRHLGSTLTVAAFNAVPLVLLMLLPEYFQGLLAVWLFGGFSLIAYFNGRILLRVFKKYELPEAEET